MDMTEVKLLARCAAISVSSWSDALDELAIDGVMQGIVKRSGGGRIAVGGVQGAERLAGEFMPHAVGLGRVTEAIVDHGP